MKPLLVKDLPNFLTRFGSFVDAEIRSIEVISTTTMRVTIACQDSARGFDWLTISLEFYGITDASLIENSKLSFIDMSNGINLTYKNNNFVFDIKNATIFIKFSSVKYEEGLF